MDIFATDRFGYHLAPIARRFAASTPLSDIGYIREKDSRVQMTFNSFNYSLILRGLGTYLYRGQMLTVQAPCVLTQWPGEPMDYGPEGTWEELYLMYNAVEVPRLRAAGLIPTDPCWPIQDPAQLQTHLTGLFRTLNPPYFDPYIDRIDAVCQMLVLESLLGRTPSVDRPQTAAIRNIERYVNTHLYSDVDFAAVASERAMHPAAFRRAWMREIGIPPSRYLTQQRIKEACRLLVETSRSIGEIAGLLRFEDPLYFSRKFRSVTGLTATEYRRRNQSSLSPTQLIDRPMPRREE